ncbi:DNA (Cytosine-5)-methyltransferase DRM1/2 isoform 4 [Hibiscus syriacus]|uniref:DNA (Cytosine-5)-methyltransferase DRM1/2 isoform 4 n=1 Tax=Hibiscus syriacus TaxID=106335 RepID=A0A6A2YU50_HIBSY|nr:DNA (Cytosine-5)-methyltransferase DRM1/2 isoform 4 [Hibiscus syriacus]
MHCCRYLLNEVAIFCIWRDLVRQSSENSLDDFTDIDSSSDIEEIMNSDSDEESKLLYLTKMGFSEVEASITMERCGSDSSIAELTDFICADQMAKVTDALLMVEDRKPLCNDPNYKQRRNLGYDFWKRNKHRKLEKKFLNEDDHAIHPLIPMMVLGNDGLPVRLLKLMTMSHLRMSRSMFLMSAENGIWYGLKRIKLFHLNLMKWKCFYVSLKTIHKDLYRDMFHGGINVLSLFSGINDAEVAFYCLVILLKTDVQELNDDRLEQLMSSFVEFDLVQSSEGHNEYHLDKENDQHRRNSNNVSRLEPASRYNQSAGSDLFMAL